MFFDVFRKKSRGFAGRTGGIMTVSETKKAIRAAIAIEMAEILKPDDMLADVAKRFCPQCGTAIIQNAVGRPKKFCSEKCRRSWHNTHPHPEHWKSTETKVCPVCGKEFLSAKDYEHKRKYCSRSCANRARAGKGK